MRRAGILALMGIAFTVCGAIVSESRSSAGSETPQGPIPGNPTDDHISVQGTSNPTLNAGLLVFTATKHTTSLFSRPVSTPDTTTTISFDGQPNTGSGP